MSPRTHRLLLAVVLAVAVLPPIGQGVLRDMAGEDSGARWCEACTQRFVRCPACRGLKLGLSWPPAKCTACDGTGYCHPGGICQVPWPD